MSNNRRRPKVGVTGPGKRLAWGRLAAGWRVQRAGGQPVWLSPDSGPFPESLDALIVTGGSDIDPSLYLDSGGPWVAADPERDAFESAALRKAHELELPVLGICRGAQLLNVIAGGSLHDDITRLREMTSNRPSLLPSKHIAIAQDSLLARAMGTTSAQVNSLHHQAVDRIGRGFRIVARDRDNLVQGIELSGARFCVGVQWHPEYLGWKPEQRFLFSAFIDAARH